MISEKLTNDLVGLQQQAHQYLMRGSYAQAGSCWEQAIAIEPNNKSHYWYLGLMLLLQRQEEEAQTTWLVGMADGESEQIEQWTVELINILETEANRQVTNEKNAVAWAIRQHIRELNPADINNLLHLIKLSIETEIYTGEELTEQGIIELLKTEPPVATNQELLLSVWQKILEYAPLSPSSLELTDACVNHIQSAPKFVRVLVDLAYQLGSYAKHLAVKFCDLGLKKTPQNIELLNILATFCPDIGEHTRGIESAQKAFDLVEEVPEKLYANYQILRAMLMAGGYWEEIPALILRHKSLLELLKQKPPTGMGISDRIINMYSSTSIFSWVQDQPQENMRLRREIAQVCQENIETACKDRIQRYSQRSRNQNLSTKKLKVGYICHCFKRHSVGWLARGLFKYHNKEQFQVYAYMIASRQRSDAITEWYAQVVDKSYQYDLINLSVADHIYEDEIDILVDLDSITLNGVCGLMALKAAPVQVTWLGWDASGIPKIDYFIADPYVLPDSAQEYYQEKIWRLPQTYIAVEGFEVGVPKLRRDELGIPSDAVIYLTVQTGSKHNPQTARLQLQIIKLVPNSYLLIKGFADREKLKNFFLEIAKSEGVDGERLKFLPTVAFEEFHRANLSIADVVLDTYPYNGATTTMEILWMCLPMVTRVGEQFAARNSYTMIMNAGITEGIAWSDEEYVEWGIKLGKDEKLRQKISWQLRKSRQTAPLWNAKQFTLEMEKAYEEMWQRYIEGGS